MKTLLILGLMAAAVAGESSTTLSLHASMVVLGVSDVKRSMKFYGETLGLASAPAPGDLPIYQAGKLKLVLNGGMPTESAGVEVVFDVASVGAARGQLEKRGCAFDGPAKEVAPGTWVTTFRDPDGHRLTLFGAR